MNLTPLQQVLQRRDNYLARISIFDSFECAEPFDHRPAFVRRFLAGGDAENPRGCTPWPVNRPMRKDADAMSDADFRRNTRNKITNEENRTDEGDYDQYLLGSEGEMDLNRISAVITRAIELRQKGTELRPDQVFELQVSELPLMSDKSDILPRAWALLILAGYDKNALYGMVNNTLDAADWSVEGWAEIPGTIKLKDKLWGPVHEVLDAFFTAHRAWYPAAPSVKLPAPVCRDKKEDSGSSPATPPPKDPKDGMPPDIASALLIARKTIDDAFSKDESERIVEDLRAFPLEENIIIRLLLWMSNSAHRDAVSDRYNYADPSQTPDVTASKWNKVKAVILMLRMLSRINRRTMAEACLQLDCLCRFNLFADTDVMEAIMDKNVDDWAATNKDKFGNYKEWLDAISWTRTREDFAFLFTLYLTDDDAFRRLWPNSIGPDPLDRLYTPPARPLPIDAFYWRHVVQHSTFGHILAWKETADFKVADHIRFLGLLRPGGRLRPEKRDRRYERWLEGIIPGWFTELATASLLRFKYWVTDPKTARRDEVEMTFWSENHQALFASAEYIAGQWFPDMNFLGVRQKGRWHKARAAERLERWLHDRLRFGFAELNSPVYYEEHLQAIFNTVDFVEDERLRKLGVMVLDLMLFDMARRNCQGSFIAASSRIYSDKKTSGWTASVRDCIEILTGSVGDICGTNEASAIYLCTSRYLNELPECLLTIATDRKVAFIDRSRVSISFAEAPNYGVGLESGADIIFWWGHSAFFTEQTYRLTQSWSERWHLRSTGAFKLFNYVDNIALRFLQAAVEGITLLSVRAVFAIFSIAFPILSVMLYPRMLRLFFDAGTLFLDLISSISTYIGKKTGLLDENDDRIRLAKTMIEQEIQDAAIAQNAGSVNERIQFYMWSSRDAMLSSLITEQKGKTSAQKEVSIATLGMNVSVFITKPMLIKDPELSGILGDFASGVPGNLALWKTIPGALDQQGGNVAPETRNLVNSVVLPIAKDDVIEDGPRFWLGKASNPLVWQHENVSISIYNPDDRQREFSHHTHAYWSWDHFDQTAFHDTPVGQWIFGRRDRRDVPHTPSEPDASFRPSKEKPWPDGSRSNEFDSGGSGYVALFSAHGMYSTPPDNRNWGAKELVCEGHNNIWITVVGDRALYGSFNGFVQDVLAARINVDTADSKCSITMPNPGSFRENKRGPLFELDWETGKRPGETNAKFDGKYLSLDDWPHFELTPSTLKPGAKLGFTVKNRAGEPKVNFDESLWRIESTVSRRKGDNIEDTTLFLEHDFTDISNPRREYNQLPLEEKILPEEISLRPSQSKLGKAFRGRERFTP